MDGAPGPTLGPLPEPPPGPAPLRLPGPGTIGWAWSEVAGARSAPVSLPAGFPKLVLPTAAVEEVAPSVVCADTGLTPVCDDTMKSAVSAANVATHRCKTLYFFNSAPPSALTLIDPNLRPIGKSGPKLYGIQYIIGKEPRSNGRTRSVTSPR
jgi:hypothetical protein